MLLQREEHGAGEVLLDGGQLLGHRAPAQRDLLRTQDADLLHQVQGLIHLFSLDSGTASCITPHDTSHSLAHLSQHHHIAYTSTPHISLALLPLAEVDEQGLAQVVQLLAQTVVLLLQLLHPLLVLSPQLGLGLGFPRGFGHLRLFGVGVAPQVLAPDYSIVLLLDLRVQVVAPVLLEVGLHWRVFGGTVERRHGDGAAVGLFLAAGGGHASDRVDVTEHF